MGLVKPLMHPRSTICIFGIALAHSSDAVVGGVSESEPIRFRIDGASERVQMLRGPQMAGPLG